MAVAALDLRKRNPLLPRSILLWRMLQAIVWLAGAAILFCLLFFSKQGILLLRL